MKNLLIKSLINMIIASIFLFCNLAVAEQITVSSANEHPYKNLIARTGNVKVIYSTNNKNLICRVEIQLDDLTWSSEEKQVSKEYFNRDPLANCLSRESAQQALLQSFLQFGRGL